MKKISLLLCPLLLLGGIASAQVTVEIIRFAPLPPALHARCAIASSWTPEKMLEHLLKNAEHTQKNIDSADEYIAELKKYLAKAEKDPERCKDAIAEAKKNLNEWEGILKAERAELERIRAEYERISGERSKKKLERHAKAIEKSGKSVEKRLAKMRIPAAYDPASAPVVQAAAAVDEEELCRDYGPYMGCVRQGDCPNSCPSRKGCWADYARRCSMNPPWQRTACWCRK